MTSTADLISETRSHMMASGREELNRLTTTMNTSIATVVIDFAANSIATGAVIAIDLELMYVWSVSGANVTVQRAYGGSTAAAHTAGALIYVNPTVSDFAIFRSLNDEIDSLSSPANGLYRVKTITITATAAGSYNLAADVVEILNVQTNDYGASLDWPRLRRWDLLRNQDTAVFASGVSIDLHEVPAPGRTIRVSYAAAFSNLATIADDVLTTTGMPATMHDIPAFGAAARLLTAREARRSSIDAQPESRQPQDVPPGTARSGAAALFALRKQRIVEEAARLSNQWPTVMKRAV